MARHWRRQLTVSQVTGCALAPKPRQCDVWECPSWTILLGVVGRSRLLAKERGREDGNESDAEKPAGEHTAGVPDLSRASGGPRALLTEIDDGQYGVDRVEPWLEGGSWPSGRVAVRC